MTHKEQQEFEQKLLARGYKRWNQAIYGTEDYDVSKSVHVEDGEDKYLIIFKFWDWRKFSLPTDGGVDVVILPCIDGRADLQLSNLGDKNKVLDVDWVEGLADDYYKFIKRHLL